MQENITRGNTFLFVDHDGNEHEINYMENQIDDNAVNANKTWSSSKIKTETQNTVNNALETLSEIKVTNKSSANDCIPTKNEKYGVFKGVFTDTPFRDGTQIIESSIVFTSNEKNVYQKVTRYGSSPEYKPISYGRYGYKNISSSSDYIWSPWQKITTETDLNNALANYKEIKKEIQTKTFTESSSGNWVCRLDNRKIKDSLILGVKVISISNGSGADACIGIIPYRYNGYPNGEAYWGLYAIQETGKSLEGITYTLEIDYVDLNSTVA